MIMIELNINLKERYYRFVLGLLLVLSGFVWYSPIYYILTHLLSFIGFILIFTGSTGWDPFYSIWDFSTLGNRVYGEKLTKLKRGNFTY